VNTTRPAFGAVQRHQTVRVVRTPAWYGSPDSRVASQVQELDVPPAPPIA
jgi:hypothetical protein